MLITVLFYTTTFRYRGIMLSILDEKNDETGLDSNLNSAFAETLSRYVVNQGILVLENNEIGKNTSHLYIRRPSLIATSAQDSSASI